MRPRGVKATERVTYVTRRELLTLIIIVLVAVISLAAWFSYFYTTPSLKGQSDTLLFERQSTVLVG